METINTYYSDYAGLREFVYNNREILLSRTNLSVLAQVFAGVSDKNLLIAISEQIQELIPGCQVLGTTTNGEIMNGFSSGLKTVLSFSVFKDTYVRVALMRKHGQSDFDLGRYLAELMNTDDARVLILFATGLTINANQLLKGIQAVNALLPVAGGNAGDNLNHHKCFVFANGEITDSGVAGALLSGEKLVAARHSHLGWQPIGKEMTITRSEGSRVYTIDNFPAYQVYQRYLGIGEELDILSSFEFPLVMEKNGILVSRIPHSFHDDNSLVFFGDIEEGEKVRFSFGHINLIIDQLEFLLDWINQQTIESIFVYSCGARRSLLGEMVDMETRPLQGIAPTAGFFTDGEFFHSDNSNQFLNNTITILALSEEGEASCQTAAERPGIARSRSSSFDFAQSRDNVANRGIGILKALTCLVNVVTAELNERTSELESQRHDFINHLHTLYGLMTMGEIDQASQYISELYREVKSSNEALKLALPELTALLITKMGVSANRDIEFKLDVHSDLMGLKARPMDMVTMLGNLLNNSMEAVEDLPPGHRRIGLTIKEDPDCFCFQTHNPGHIPEDIQRRIFEPGFSTKQGTGNRGLGLPSVLHLAGKYQGSIELKSLPGQGTSFMIKIPR